MSLVSACELCYQAGTSKSRFEMPRDDDRNNRGRPPGRRGPPRGKGAFGGKGSFRDKRGAGDERPREPRKPGGRAFRKADGETSQGEGGTHRPAGKRFGGAKTRGREFGDKRPFGAKRPAGDKRRFGAKPGRGFGKAGNRPRRGFDRSDRAPSTEFARGDNAGAE